jgi:ATP-binding cassette, subfamily B (MDR/TAP), member 1
MQMQESLAVKMSKHYCAGNAIVEEVLSSIRTVVAFGGEKKEMER